VPVNELLPEGARHRPRAGRAHHHRPGAAVDGAGRQGGSRWPGTPPPSRASAATTTAASCRSGRRTCARWRSSTTPRRARSPSSSSTGACSRRTPGARWRSELRELLLAAVAAEPTCRCFP
jgi:hypothetical protein